MSQHRLQSLAESSSIFAMLEQLCVTKQRPPLAAFPMGERKRQVAQIPPGGAGRGERTGGVEMTDDRARAEVIAEG